MFQVTTPRNLYFILIGNLSTVQVSGGVVFSMYHSRICHTCMYYFNIYIQQNNEITSKPLIEECHLLRGGAV
jgi:hypothetical protein